MVTRRASFIFLINTMTVLTSDQVMHDSINDEVYHSLPLEVERKYISVHSSLKGSLNESNVIDYMMVDESKPVLSHMPVVEIMNQRHLLNHHRSSTSSPRFTDRQLYMPVADVLPALNLQIDTLGAGGSVNGQTNFRIQSSGQPLNALFDIVPSDLKAIPMEVKSSEKQYSSDTSSNQPESAFGSQSTSSLYQLNEVKKVKRNKPNKKASLEYVNRMREVNDIDDEEGRQEIEKPSKNYDDAYGKTFDRYTSKQVNKLLSRGIHLPRSNHDSASHSIRKLERDNDKFDNFIDSEVNERLKSALGHSRSLSSISGRIRSINDEKTRKIRQRTKVVDDQSDANYSQFDQDAPSHEPLRYISSSAQGPRAAEDTIGDKLGESYKKHRNFDERIVRSQRYQQAQQTIHLPQKSERNFVSNVDSQSDNDEDDVVDTAGQPKNEIQIDFKQRVQNGHWNYEDEDKWSKRFASCDGSSQSPINIQSNFIVDDSSLSLELMPSYDSKIPIASMVNTGLTVEVVHVNGPRPSITGSAVYEDVFTFHKVHFHWGSKNSLGSEHAVFDQKYPMEMHLLHYNDKYESMEKAMNQPDGLSVIAIFLQVTKSDNPRFDSIIKSLKRVMCGGTSIPFNGSLNLTNFLPSNVNEFYRYQGSLTTPPCSESVLWLILKHGLLIGKNQLKKFRQLRQFDCATPIMNNWRNIQPVNGRRIDRAIGEN